MTVAELKESELMMRNHTSEELESVNSYIESISVPVETWKVGKQQCVSFSTPKSKRLCRLITASPDMYNLMKDTAQYIFECTKLYKSFPDELVTYAERIQELLARIDGEEDNAES